MRRICASLFAAMLFAIVTGAYGQSKVADDPTVQTGRAADVGVGNNSRIDPVTVAIPAVNPAQMPVASGAATAPGADSATRGVGNRRLPNGQSEKVMCFVAGQGYVVTDAISCDSHRQQSTRLVRQPARQDTNAVRAGAHGAVEAPLPSSPEDQTPFEDQSRLAGATRMTPVRIEKLQAIQSENGANSASLALPGEGDQGASTAESLTSGGPRQSTAKVVAERNREGLANPSVASASHGSAADRAKTQAMRSARNDANRDTHQQVQTRYEKCLELAKNKDKSMKDERLYQRTCSNF
ncbi:hypothetical protein Acid345_3303 [Candidatus Koribacter versatilis Ellin345]|uniref:Lipoprotein n=1 Tax=Koribacter versatilis (strain Ellin345) TaxID=204669 RepID=Q1ILE6_KORVE|nr:hypothetical protein [Candidatus Koribacter versatilis]ABF42304.1 hypothetical protein Acid345_3303 [Candidatus Koribacter versatilis Ellin345]